MIEEGRGRPLRRRSNSGEAPEVLAPAGDLESLRAALAAGADAVYFGVTDGFNARARAANFSSKDLDTVSTRAHRAGARAYLTLNTLVFDDELETVERILLRASEAGVDAVIVQDPAVALLAGSICPGLHVHASTQMGVATPAAGRLAMKLGVRRAILPRELSLADIEIFAAECELEWEVFVHGALCMSWSGQCLASLDLFGRSGNRGQCAQPCRLPHTVEVDGNPPDPGRVPYPLSPRDLSAESAVKRLIELGVDALKIEGRLKGPDYVATAVRGVRSWVDAALGESPSPEASKKIRRDMALTFSRGFGVGFLRELDHQSLVDGRCPKHRGLIVGLVDSVGKKDVTVSPDPNAPEVRPGMGVVFDDGRPDDPSEPGGPIFRVDWRQGALVLGFGRPGPELSRVRPGQRVWVTSDPAIEVSIRRLLEAAEPSGRVPLRLMVHGYEGTALRVRGTACGFEVVIESEVPLAASKGGGLSAGLLEEKLGALGGTPFRLEVLDSSELPPGLHLPVSELKSLRRRLVEELVRHIEIGPTRDIVTEPSLPKLLDSLRPRPVREQPRVEPILVPLCRNRTQLDAALEMGFREIELDFFGQDSLGKAVELARAAGARVVIATSRVTLPGENRETSLLRLEPNGVLLRSLHDLETWPKLTAGQGIELHGDASLNVTNRLSAQHLLSLGLSTLTPAHDARGGNLDALLAGISARFTFFAQGRLPLFHTRHCIFARHLSKGRDSASCGRVCEGSELALRDQAGRLLLVRTDAACRNTVFHGQPSSSPRLGAAIAAGVRRFRVELLHETRTETIRLLGEYLELLDGEHEGSP